MVVDIREIPQEDWKKWDCFVLAQRDGTVFHTTHWLKHQPVGEIVIFGFYLDNVLVGGFIINEITKAGFKIIPQPVLTPYNHPVFSDKVICERRVELFQDYFLKILSIYDSYRISESYTTDKLFQNLAGVEPVHQFRTQILTKSEENFYASSLKRNIKKAQKNNLVVEQSSDFEAIYELSTLSYQNSGRSHPFEKESFINLCEEIEEFGLGAGFMVKNQSGTPVAGCFLPLDKHRAYNVINGLNRDFKELQPGALLLDEAISYCRNRMLDFDFEGSQQDRINDFYQKFGPEEKYFYHYHQNSNRLLRAASKMGLVRV